MATKTIAKSDKKPARPAAKNSGGSYFQAVMAEAKKVTWPTLPQIWANTLIVLVMTILFSSMLWLIDNIFRAIIGFIT